MTVLALSWNADTQQAELIEADDTLETWLRSAVIMSLFTDGRATEDEEPEITERRGYWGDIELDDDDSLGSKLWLHRRSKLTNDVANQVQDEAQTALDWLVEDSHVSSLAVTVERQPPDRLAYQIDITLLDGETLNMTLEQGQS
ncbi:phage GP46 family protein [Oceanobacter sp. 4_MG-2023]|uniref:phage GP46 family protein n=1 Tax=Oceanobacter sp. 4_MG-2023 TaxID=3062623 RepID=UPI0027370730|nr:phage GP46 family protein [Oceanobacter sp. 4_MG-2023]MDP2548475.1 phage GP46 family protein [Oceanobacter sp. 4_MG-2023]